MIKFGIRQSLDRIEQVEDRYANLSVPVEVALPYYWDIYDPVRGHLAEIAEKIKSYNATVLGIDVQSGNGVLRKLDVHFSEQSRDCIIVTK